jgi:hypothetical protein
MKREVSPVIGGIVVAVIVIVVGALLWVNSTKQDHGPDKPPSGPITLPPSQQNRRMPTGNFSGTMPGAPGGAR